MIRVRDGWQARRGRWWWIAALILVPVVLGSALSVALLLSLVDATSVGEPSWEPCSTVSATFNGVTIALPPVLDHVRSDGPLVGLPGSAELD